MNNEEFTAFVRDWFEDEIEGMRNLAKGANNAPDKYASLMADAAHEERCHAKTAYDILKDIGASTEDDLNKYREAESLVESV